MISIFTYIFIVIAGIILLVFIAGLLLPDERTATSECFYNASPEKVYNALINNADYGYRSDLEEIVIVEEKDGIEVWDEIAKNGSVIRFRTARKVPHSLCERKRIHRVLERRTESNQYGRNSFYIDGNYPDEESFSESRFPPFL